MKIIKIIIDSLFPPRVSELLVRELATEVVRTFYQPQNISGCVCLSTYKNPAVAALIAENKFYGNGQASEFLAILLEKWTNSQSSQLILVPVPLGRKRRRERGYNQVTEVLKHLNESTHHKIRLDLCSRTKETPAQLSLSRKERLTNVKNAFRANVDELQKIRDVTLVIVDDVHTTGATMTAVRAELEPSLDTSCKIICLALAH